MELILYTGSGGIRMFNKAIFNEANGNSYYQRLGESEIRSGKDGYLYNSRSEQESISSSNFLKHHFKLIGTTDVEEEQGYKESNDKLEYDLDMSNAINTPI